MMNRCNGWDAGKHAYIQFEPDERVSEKYRAWQGCPTLASTRKGRLFAGWYTGGEYEPCILNYNVLVKSDDGGEHWSAPLLTIGTDEGKKQRKIDIQLWMSPENHLWVMWTVSPYYDTSRPASVRGYLEGERWDYHREFPCTEVMVCKHPDADELVWEEPRYLCDGFTRCQPIQTHSGRIIVPAYDYGGEAYTFRISDDGGQTFTTARAEGKPDTAVYDELTLCEEAPGYVWFLARTNRGVYLRGESHDNGETWSRAEKYEDAPSTRCYIGKLQNGMTVYVRNVDNVRRAGFKIGLSQDGGKTFPHQLVIDDRENVSYPDVVQDEGGNIYVIYDRERDNRHHLDRDTWISGAAKEILLCHVTAEDILSGKPGEKAMLQKIISKGGCHFAPEKQA